MTQAAQKTEALAGDRAVTVDYALILGDTALILGQRLSEWTSHAPTVELDIALANQALDMVGQARMLLDHAGKVEGAGRTEDDIAYLRDAHAFRNVQLVELPNGDFGRTMVRQLLFGAFATELFGALQSSRDAQLAGIAQKAVKEVAYHARHGGEWVVRLGDGTPESHARVAQGLEELWPYTHELFAPVATETAAAELGIGVDPSCLREAWLDTVGAALARAGLERPRDGWAPGGGKSGMHTEHLGFILAEMQFLQRAYPGAKW
jgi:ring-1,2-phenylacetyl-CoA epoxidase subunit PaaC